MMRYFVKASWKIYLGCLGILWLAPLASNVSVGDIPPDITFRSGIDYRPGGTGGEWQLDYAKLTNPGSPLPVIVMIHGGGWIEGDKSSFRNYCVFWAQHRFFVASINYRLARAGRTTFPEAIGDCKCAIRWLRANATELNIDPKRIAVYGNSAGGHLALMLGILSKKAGDEFEGDGPYQDQSSDVCAVVSDSGVISLDELAPSNQTLKTDFELFLGGTPPAADLVRKASPATYADRAPTLPPFLLLYGTADTQVPIEITDRFVEALRARGHKDLTYMKYPGVDHCPWSIQWEQRRVMGAKGSRQLIDVFFERAVKNGKL